MAPVAWPSSDHASAIRADNEGGLPALARIENEHGFLNVPDLGQQRRLPLVLAYGEFRPSLAGLEVERLRIVVIPPIDRLAVTGEKQHEHVGCLGGRADALELCRDVRLGDLLVDQDFGHDLAVEARRHLLERLGEVLGVLDCVAQLIVGRAILVDGDGEHVHPRALARGHAELVDRNWERQCGNPRGAVVGRKVHDIGLSRIDLQRLGEDNCPAG